MPAPSDFYSFNFQSVFEWSALVIVLISVAYAAIVIKNEKISYLEDSLSISIGLVQLFYPKWWGVSKSSDNEVLFQRHDTRYDWQGRLRVYSSTQTVESFLNSYLKEKQIEPDGSYGSFEKTTEVSYLIKNEKVQKSCESFLRLESVATEKNEERIYLDIILIKFKSELEKVYVFESKSSVLNGCVEGPYFEECIKMLRFVA